MPKTSLLRRILDYKPGNWEFIVAALVLFVGAAFFVRYKMTGRVDLKGMLDPEAEYRQPFWDRNPQLEYVDSDRRSSLMVVKERSTGRKMLVDTTVVIPAKLTLQDCGVGSRDMILPGATNMQCVAIDKPETGAGVSFASGVSYDVPGRQDDVARFYRELFMRRDKKVSVMEDSSRATILEAENLRGDTEARLSTRSSFGMASVFFAWTPEFMKGTAGKEK